MMKKKYDFSTVVAQYKEALSERADFEAEWRQISEYLLPGRGVYQTYTKPRKRKLTSPKVINTVAEDALYVLTSGMHGGLTSPSRPWFSLGWTSQQLNDLEPLKMWLQESEDLLHAYLQTSNFYSIINSFYVEYAGYGTASMYVGDDTGSSKVPFRFELLTAGEYSLAYGGDGKPEPYFRTIFLTERQLVAKFPNTVSSAVKKRVNKNSAGIDSTYATILEGTYKEPHGDMAYTQYKYELTGVTDKRDGDGDRRPLEVSGFYEFPYPTARWSTIGSDTYGIGPGSRALPDIKRLQEMEKAFLMATHKTINPPLNIPARMKGKLSALPGGRNYYSNPNEMVKELYQVNFDYTGVSAAIERVEARIQRNFFNDIFLTASRDPNASPLRTGQVMVQEQEKMLRLGPVVERLSQEFLQDVVERCFNILLRRDLLPPLSPELAELAGDYKISLVSPLATAQRAVAQQGIQTYMGFVAQVAQFDQRALDNVDIDAAIADVADISGVRLGIQRTQDAIANLRAIKAQAVAQEREGQAAQLAQLANSQMSAEAASATLDQSQSALNLIEGQQRVREGGI